MTDTVRFRCKNCGQRFTAEILTDREKEIARREHRATSSVRCPECNRTDIRRGWD